MSTTAEAARDSAIDRGSRHADPDWMRGARLLIEGYAPGTSFTSEDVLIDLLVGHFSTHDKRALGGVLQKAQRDGLIEPGGFVPSRRPSRHCAPVREWRRV